MAKTSKNNAAKRAGALIKMLNGKRINPAFILDTKGRKQKIAVYENHEMVKDAGGKLIPFDKIPY